MQVAQATTDYVALGGIAGGSGTTGTAQTGYIRLPYAATTAAIVMRNSTSTGDIPLIGYNTSIDEQEILVGSGNSGPNVSVAAQNAVQLVLQATWAFTLTTSTLMNSNITTYTNIGLGNGFNFTFSNAAPGSDVSPGMFTIAASPAYASAASNTTGAAMILKGGVKATQAGSLNGPVRLYAGASDIPCSRWRISPPDSASPPSITALR